MAFTTIGLLQGFAGLLDTLVPPLSYAPAGVYAAGAWGTYLAALPPERDRAVALTAYPVTEEGGAADIHAIQVRVRGRPNNLQDVLDVDDAIFTAVHNLRGVTFGGTYVSLIWRNSSVPMGMDSNRRHELSSNYYLHTNRPTIHRAD